MGIKFAELKMQVKSYCAVLIFQGRPALYANKLAGLLSRSPHTFHLNMMSLQQTPLTIRDRLLQIFTSLHFYKKKIKQFRNVIV